MVCLQDYVDAAVQQAIAIHVGFRPKSMGWLQSTGDTLVYCTSCRTVTKVQAACGSMCTHSASLVRVAPEVRRLVMLLPQSSSQDLEGF